MRFRTHLIFLIFFFLQVNEILRKCAVLFANIFVKTTRSINKAIFFRLARSSYLAGKRSARFINAYDKRFYSSLKLTVKLFNQQLNLPSKITVVR